MLRRVFAGVPEGRRERKKLATRDAIAASARCLFAERGFDAVRSLRSPWPPTLPRRRLQPLATKDDLVFAGREQRLEALLARVAQRPAGMCVIDVFRATTEGMIDDLVAEGDDEVLAVRRIIRGRTTLQECSTMGWEEEATALAAVIAETAGAAADDVIPAVVARTLVWTHRTIFRDALTGEELEQMAARLRVQATRAYDRLAAGLAVYGAADPGVDTAP